MKTEINAIFFDIQQSYIENVGKELIDLNYILNHKLIEDTELLKLELKSTQWDIFITTNEDIDRIDSILNISKNTYILIVSDNRNPDFIKSIFKKNKCDLVSKSSIEEITLRVIRSYEKSKVVQFTDDNSNNLLQKADERAEEMYIRLMAKSEELENVVYITSHDIRSPVVNILGFSDEMIKALGKLSAKIFDETNTIHNKDEIEYLLNKDIPQIQNFVRLSGKKIDTLLLALLNLSRLGRVEINKANVNMNKVITNVVSGFEGIITQENININIADIPECFTDETIINQIFTHIIDNAIKFRNKEEESYINISAKQNGESITYCVCDNGIGISETDIEKIFDVFFRVNPEIGEGEGIGLSLVKKAVERLDGKVVVKCSQEGSNTKREELNTQVFITIEKQRV